MKQVLFASTLALLMSGCALPHQDDIGLKPSCDFADAVYPVVSRQRRESGEVALKISANREGQITHVAVLESSGHPLLDNAAISAIKRSKCRPFYADGAPAEFTMTVFTRFNVI